MADNRRRRVTAVPGTTIRDRDYRPALDATAMPRSTVRGMNGPLTGRGRSAIVETPADEPVYPDMRDSSYWPEMPGPGTVRRLKKGGPVKAASKAKRKKK